MCAIMEKEEVSPTSEQRKGASSMSIAICRVQKIGAPKDIAGIQIHNRREREHSNTNPDIDRTRSAQNYSMYPLQTPEKSYNALIDERIKQGYTGKKAVRKDAVRCCEVLFTASGDFFEQHPEQIDKFFGACLMFSEQRFGADNIIAATVHMDEDTPHMHLDFVPLTADGRLSAKSVLGGRKDMQQLQDDFYEQVGKQFGLERGSRADLDDVEADQPRKHLSTKQLKAETAAHLAEQEQQIEQRSEQLIQLERQLDIAEKAYHEAVAGKTFAENDALLAEERARQVDTRAEAVEARLQSAETKLKEVNGQYDVATKGLKKVLDSKARASEIHKITDLFGETQSYHKNMLESTRAIGSNAYDWLQESQKLRQEAVSIQVRAEQKEQEITPLHQQAKEAYRQAEQERKRAQQLRQNIEQEIEKRARELSDSTIQEMFGGVATRRERRLEDFCDEIKFKDGSSVLDAFLEQEERLKKIHRNSQSLG